MKISMPALPVGENDRLVGMLTDRDIMFAQSPKARHDRCHVREVMSHDIKCVYDDDLSKTRPEHGQLQMRRLPY
jgi:CBS domain-containing protein